MDANPVNFIEARMPKGPGILIVQEPMSISSANVKPERPVRIIQQQTASLEHGMSDEGDIRPSGNSAGPDYIGVDGKLTCHRSAVI